MDYLIPVIYQKECITTITLEEIVGKFRPINMEKLIDLDYSLYIKLVKLQSLYL